MPRHTLWYSLAGDLEVVEGVGDSEAEEIEQQASPESLHALADHCVNRHSGLQNYFVNTAIEFWLLRRLGLEPLSWPGRLVGGLVSFLMVLLPALFLTALIGQWVDAPWVPGPSLP